MNSHDLLLALLFFMALILSQNFNPMNMAIILTSFASVLFFNVWQSSSDSWFPTIILMIFLGGILMMFMMVCSVSPNENMPKMKMSWLVLGILTAIFFMAGDKTSSQSTEMKWMLESKMVLWFVVIVIGAYFFAFVYMISEKKTSLKSMIICQLTTIL